MKSTRLWKHKVNIKQYLTEDESWEGIIKAANSVAKELRTLPLSYFDDYNFEDDVEFLESTSMDDANVLESEQELLAEVNFRLESIYNFADYNRIWLGHKENNDV